VESYRTEEEQVEALKKWWDENGRGTVVAIIVALGVGFGWQGWKGYQSGQSEAASERYQALLQALSEVGSDEDLQAASNIAGQIKTEHARSSYAQFAALHLARMAASEGNLDEAEAELRWVLGRADKGSDTYQLAQLRLARVLASAGEGDQALSILDGTDPGAYQAANAVARGDALLMLGRRDEARQAYAQALNLAARGDTAGVDLPMVQQKLQSLSPTTPRESVRAAETDGDVTPVGVEE
jgi:predicted negative regulator of RcsB-dependent stress response